MPVKRELWREPLAKNYTPSWHCPSCSGGYLNIVPDSLQYIETHESKKAHDHPAWDPDWIVFRFSALLKCQNNNCEEAVSVAGKGRVEMVQTSHSGDLDYIEFFYPEFVSPSPDLFQIPDECPDEILSEIQQAFIAVWCDYASAATRIRASIERLLDHLKEPKTKINVTIQLILP